MVTFFIQQALAAQPSKCPSLLTGKVEKEAGIQAALERAVHNPANLQAIETARSLLGLDELNFTYFMTLLKKYRSETDQLPLAIYPKTGPLTAYPLGVDSTPADIEREFQKVEYPDLQAQYDGRYAQATVFVHRPLQAGTGSSLSRQSYLNSRKEMRRLLGISSEGPIELSAKGSDLLARLPSQGQVIEVPLTELQILQKIAAGRSQAFGKIVHQDLVGPETQQRLASIWKKISEVEGKTYQQIFAADTKLQRAPMKPQSKVPTVTRTGSISFNRVAPAGHGFFAVDAILEAKSHRAGTNPKVVAISNGEDMNSTADAVMIDWIVKNRVPIALVTTSKSSTDKKGGILTLVRDSRSGELFMKVVDTAEAEAANQLEYFQNLGGYASTNLTIFNYDALQSLLKDISSDELLSAAAPDLIPNWKKQMDTDGVEREYLQLEGAMGSVIMNLDRYFRRKTGKSIVRVINIPEDQRVNFFTPIKFAFDYFLQFHSDRYEIDPTTFKLRHMGGNLPMFSLSGSRLQKKYYQDVQNVLDSFSGSSFRNAVSFEVDGLFVAKNFIFTGNVQLVNRTNDILDLQTFARQIPKAKDGRLRLTNSRVVWDGENLKVTRIRKANAEPLSSSATAHARIGIAGSHTDYNAGFALAQLIPSAKTKVSVQRRSDNIVSVLSAGQKAQYEVGKEQATGDWGDYIQGITKVLQESGFKITGFNAQIESNIPMGSGISSSAALVTATLKAVRRAFTLPINNFEIAKMGQKVEHFVGANVGLLDQTTISVLDQDLESALLIDFSAFEYKKVAMPEKAEFTVIHSGLAHSLKDEHGTRNYATRRAETEEAARLLGVPNLSVLNLRELEARKDQLSELLYKRSKHVITENERLHQFLSFAKRGDLAGIGRLMQQSHLSQKDDYDISEAPINALVEILNSTPGVYGAQLTGGGFGGSVVFLSEKGKGQAIAESVVSKYLTHPSNAGRFQPLILQGSE